MKGFDFISKKIVNIKDLDFTHKYVTIEVDGRKVQRYFEEVSPILEDVYNIIKRRNKGDVKVLLNDYKNRYTTPSQRLRNVLYVLYGQRNISLPFEEFYESSIEKFINKVKEKLE